MPGHKVLLQGGGKIPEGLICPHCKLILNDPVQTTETGLRFCRECFTRAPSGLDPNDEARSDVAARKEIDKLCIVCVNKMTGCEWKGLFKDYAEHLISCEREDIPRFNGVQPTSVTCSCESGSKLNEDLRINGLQQVSGADEDVLPSVNQGNQAQSHPPLGNHGFQEFTTYKLDEIEKRTDNIEQWTDKAEKQIGNAEKRTDSIEQRTDKVEKWTGIMEKRSKTMDRKIDDLVQKHMDFRKQLLYSNCDGFYYGYLIWRIPGVAKQLRCIGADILYSRPFYTKPGGYKMCLAVYLNGDGAGKGSHLSVYFTVLQGEYDPLQEWPFRYKVSLMLLNQDYSQDAVHKDVIRSFTSDPMSSSFQRPTSFKNPSIGFQKFASLETLSDPKTGYVKDDVMFLQAVVDVE